MTRFETTAVWCAIAAFSFGFALMAHNVYEDRVTCSIQMEHVKATDELERVSKNAAGWTNRKGSLIRLKLDTAFLTPVLRAHYEAQDQAVEHYHRTKDALNKRWKSSRPCSPGRLADLIQQHRAESSMANEPVILNEVDAYERYNHVMIQELERLGVDVTEARAQMDRINERTLRFTDWIKEQSRVSSQLRGSIYVDGDGK